MVSNALGVLRCSDPLPQLHCYVLSFCRSKSYRHLTATVEVAKNYSMNDTQPPMYSIDELATRSDMPRRTVRYYIQQGLVDRPIGEKRAAYYTASHLEQLLAVRKWQRAGLSLDRIRELLAHPEAGQLPVVPARGPGTIEVWSHLVVMDGVEIMLEPGRAGLSQSQVRAFFSGVTDLMKAIEKTGDDHAEK